MAVWPQARRSERALERGATKKRNETASSTRESSREKERFERREAIEREPLTRERESRTRMRRGACVSLYKGHAHESESRRLNKASDERADG